MTEYQKQKLVLAIEQLENILLLFEKRDHCDSFFDEKNEDYVINPYFSMIEDTINTLEEIE